MGEKSIKQSRVILTISTKTKPAHYPRIGAGDSYLDTTPN
jgi:hypothetical protein